MQLKLDRVAAACLVVGLLSLARATFFDTDVGYDRTFNIGLMQVQMLWSNFGLAMLMISSVLFVGDHIAKRVERVCETRTGD